VKAAAFASLLFYGVLTLWVAERWAWSAFQVGIFALAAYCIWTSARLIIPPALVLLGVAALWPLIQIALNTTSSRGATLEAAFDWFTFVVIFGVGSDILRQPPQRRWFLQRIVLFGMVVAVLAIVQQHTSAGKVFWLFPSGFPDDVLGPFVNRNQYAAWVELLLPVALYQALTERTNRFLPVCAAAALFASVVAGASRAGFVLASLEIVVAIALFTARRRVSRQAILQLSLALVLAAGVAGWQTLHQRFSAPATETLRLDAARASLRMVREHPLIGFGLGTWPVIYPRYARIDTGLFVNEAHNDWLQWAAEGGVPFLLVMLVFAALLWKRAIRSIYGLGTISFLLHALVDYPMRQRPALAAWFFAIAAAMMAERKPDETLMDKP
jgi:O-antigen ligase